MPKPKKNATRPVKKRITVHDVAKAAGVSTATVSYVLNDRGSISDQVRKKVRKTAEKLGYLQNKAARTMKMGHSDIVGLVIPNIVNPFFATLVQAVLLECQRHKYQVFLVDTEGSHDTEVMAIQGLAQQGVDGIIVFPIDDRGLEEGAEVEVPVIVLDRDSRDKDLVQAEYVEGGRLLAEHLLALGHTRFGVLEGPQYVTSALQRSEGFIHAVGDRGQIVWRQEHPFSMTLTDEGRRVLLRQDVTAVFCGNDLIAMGAINFLQEQGVAIPSSVSIVGFDDIPFSKMLNPALTTIHMPIRQMGIEAVDLLIKRLQSPDSESPRSRIVLGVDLIVRASSGPA